MNLSRVRKNILFSKDSFLAPVLVLFIIWGLITKFFISMNLPLTSDSVGMGLMSMEIGKHHNYLLSGYHLLSSDSLVFTELIPFQLIPQILTNYSPAALRFMVFFIFGLSVLALAYLVWLVSGNILSALLFGALAASIPPGGYYYLAYPTSHTATILFGAMILIIIFSLHRSLDMQKETRQKTRKEKMHTIFTLPLSYSLALVTLVFLSVLSDTIIIFWVLVPYCTVYLLFFRKGNRGMDSVVIFIVTTSVFAYLLKTYVIHDWLSRNYPVNTSPVTIFLNIPLFFKAQLLLLNSGVSTLIGEAGSIGAAEVLFAVLSSVLFAGVIFSCVRSGWNGWHDYPPRIRLLYAVLLTSVLLMAGSVLVSDYFVDIDGARYLTFTALALLMLVAISCPVTEKTCVFFVLSLLIVSAIAGGIYINTANPNPNDGEFGLITYLRGQNLTFGFGTYWDANSITYLSGEDVTIRSAFFRPNHLIQRDRLNSCDRWWLMGMPDRYFIIYNATQPMDTAQKTFIREVESDNTSRILHYRDYEIFPLNGSQK